MLTVLLLLWPVTAALLLHFFKGKSALSFSRGSSQPRE